ncbi:unnamed protein product [Ilex paraguariensis]|uniref:Uncharacterized protein n=1 Tax=Ilex paraguariensis TaxID=185542 RepID=A0ABC8UTT5_9AQUA
MFWNLTKLAAQTRGYPLFQVIQKLKLVKVALKDLNRRKCSDISGRVNEMRKKLHDIQRAMQHQSNLSQLQQLEKETLSEKGLGTMKNPFSCRNLATLLAGAIRRRPKQKFLL